MYIYMEILYTAEVALQIGRKKMNFFQYIVLGQLGIRISQDREKQDPYLTPYTEIISSYI